MDVKMAYLHGVFKEEIYMEQLEGFIAEGDEDKVCKLMHSLYGLKQAGQVWSKTFANIIKRKLGFNPPHPIWGFRSPEITETDQSGLINKCTLRMQ